MTKTTYESVCYGISRLAPARNPKLTQLTDDVCDRHSRCRKSRGPGAVRVLENASMPAAGIQSEVAGAVLGMTARASMFGTTMTITTRPRDGTG